MNTQNGLQFGYTVEARLVQKLTPQIVCGNALDGEWRTLHFQRGGGGVPARHELDHGLGMFHLYTYEAAQALRWWFLANADSLGRLIETRLVRHKVEYSAKCTEEGPQDVHSWATPREGDLALAVDATPKGGGR